MTPWFAWIFACDNPAPVEGADAAAQRREPPPAVSVTPEQQWSASSLVEAHHATVAFVPDGRVTVTWTRNAYGADSEACGPSTRPAGSTRCS